MRVCTPHFINGQYSLCHPLAQELSVLSIGTAKDFQQLFLEEDQLKTADKVIREEKLWFDERTKQGQEHFMPGALAFLASRGKCIGIRQAWDQWSKKSFEIIFEKMRMSKMLSATGDRNFVHVPSRTGYPQKYKERPVLAIRPGEIWDENMLRNPAHDGGCSECYGCKEGCQYCQTILRCGGALRQNP